MEKNIRVILPTYDDDSRKDVGVDVEHNPLMAENIFKARKKEKTSLISMENESDSADEFVSDLMEIDEIKNNYLNLPRANSPERIIICLDISSEMTDSNFRLPDGSIRTFFNAVKQAVIMYIHTKHLIDPRHQFALVLLSDQAVWLGDFSNDPQMIIGLIKEVHDTITCDSMRILPIPTRLPLMEVTMERVQLPQVKFSDVIPPDYIIRAILLYGRSQCIPQFDFDQVAQKDLLESKYFFLDTIYLHKKAVDGNKCED
uniref:BRISC and BRCA1-A complex member 1 n=1 Tax=Strigamia maritima TaxID=126957 RepID=T1JKD2_STRMM